MGTTELEAERLRLQQELDTAKSQADRNRLGQFATPSALAADILKCAKIFWSPGRKVRFLDPALGTGAFYSALLNEFPSSQIESAMGYEIDPRYAKEALRLWGDKPLDLRIGDFTRATPPSTDQQKPNLVICNPPYVRHHHIHRHEKIRLQKRTQEVTGLRLSGLAGLYSHFLCLSYDWLASRGLAGWLVPSEFMDVNYGQAVKQFLLEHVTLLRVHRFDPEDVQFDDALVSSAVVWFRKEVPRPTHGVEFSYGGSLADPKVLRCIPASRLRHSTKWTRFPLANEPKHAAPEHTTLAHLFTIKRGLATGANKFFILDREQAAEHRIPPDFLKPILPSPRYLQADVIEADSNGNPIVDRPQFHLACNLPEDEVKMKHPTLWRYFQRGLAAGISRRYLCRNRSPWYAQEYRPPSMFLCTYMGRQGTHGKNPFRFILNQSRATAANVYLMLYPKPELQRAIKENPDLAEVVWHGLRTISTRTLIGEGRVYGGGLYKVEPKELANAPAGQVLEALQGVVDSPRHQMMLFPP